MACSVLLTCRDAEDAVSMLNEPDEDMPPSQKAFINCLTYIYNHMKREKPWKISKDFISELGSHFLSFKILNSGPHKSPRHHSSKSPRA
ncbi:hypothetical protein FACS1894208_01740 [Clostridia bacterium]|nr:hypothetical protein FACS1894208_01740 [Clostridia bacterium]